MRKDMLALLRLIRASGYAVTPTGGGHWKVSAVGHQSVYMSATPSCPRAVIQARADLKRAGYVLG